MEKVDFAELEKIDLCEYIKKISFEKKNTNFFYFL